MSRPTCARPNHNDWTDGPEGQPEGGPAHKDGNARGLFTYVPDNKRGELRHTVTHVVTVMHVVISTQE